VSAFSQSARWESLDLDAAAGCIRDTAHACSPDGGPAMLWGNLAPDGTVVKSADTGAVRALPAD
jgi:dihydroxy-acid dehydratase